MLANKLMGQIHQCCEQRKCRGLITFETGRNREKREEARACYSPSDGGGASIYVCEGG
jgi:hypothetical protein